jgi:hypothetical protein
MKEKFTLHSLYLTDILSYMQPKMMMPRLGVSLYME